MLTKPVDQRDGAATVSMSIQALIALVAVQAVLEAGFFTLIALGASHPDAWRVVFRLSGPLSYVAAIAFVVARGVRLPWMAGKLRIDSSEMLRASLGCSLIASAIYVLLGPSVAQVTTPKSPMSVAYRIADFGSAVALSPFLEEFLFRGVLLRSLLRRTSNAAAVISSAALFSAFHYSAARSSSALVLGIALGVILLRSESVWPCIAAHLSWNLCMRLAQSSDAVPQLIDDLKSSALDGTYVTVSATAGLLLIVWPFKRCKTDCPKD